MYAFSCIANTEEYEKRPPKVVNIFILSCLSLYQFIFRKERTYFFSCYDISITSFDFLAGLHLSKVENTYFRWKKKDEMRLEEGESCDTRRKRILDALLPCGQFRAFKEETHPKVLFSQG